MRKIVILMLALFAALSLPAFGDTIIWASSDLSAGANISASAGTFTGSITFTNASSTDQMIIALSLQLLNGNGSISNLSITGLPSGWNFYGGKQSNNGTPCDESGHANWFCADGFATGGVLPYSLGKIPKNGSLTLDFSGDYTGTPLTTGSLDLMANGCTSTNFTSSTKSGHGEVTCSKVGSADGKWAYSDVIGGHSTPPTPEPASLMLLASGLAGLALRRRK